MCFPRKELHNRHQKRQHGFSDPTLPEPEILPELDLDAVLSAQPISSPETSSTSNGNATGMPDSLLDRTASVWLDSTVLANSPQRNGVAVHDPQRQSLQSNHISAPSPVSQRSFGITTDQATSPNLPQQTWQPTSSIQSLLDPAPIQSSVAVGFNSPPDVLTARNGNIFQRALQFSHDHVGSFYEDDLWLSSLDASYQSGSATPYPFFTTGFESLPTAGYQMAPAPSSTKQPMQLQISDEARGRLQAAFQGMYGVFRGPTDSHGQFSVPERTTLDRYWKMFWAVPNRNLPFIHQASTSAEHAPIAMILAVFADGAMYCGDKHVGMAFFECSRRLVSQYMDNIGSKSATVPLWVVNTLIINCVFGLPGGDAPHCGITVASHESILSLASRVVPLSSSALQAQQSTIDEQWRSFIEVESHKR